MGGREKLTVKGKDWKEMFTADDRKEIKDTGSSRQNRVSPSQQCSLCSKSELVLHFLARSMACLTYLECVCTFLVGDPKHCEFVF